MLIEYLLGEQETQDQSTAITPTETNTMTNLTIEPTQITEATIKSEKNEEGLIKSN